MLCYGHLNLHFALHLSSFHMILYANLFSFCRRFAGGGGGGGGVFQGRRDIGRHMRSFTK